jgi:hypothetical protein
MGLGKFIGSVVGSGVGELATSVADVVDRFVETDEEKEAAAILRMKIQQEPDRWQTEINAIEAKHRTIFVAGWRPFIGWVCGVSLAMNFVVFPMMEWITKLRGDLITRPEMDTGALMTLVISLLGLGATRTYEKMIGISK